MVLLVRAAVVDVTVLVSVSVVVAVGSVSMACMFGFRWFLKPWPSASMMSLLGSVTLLPTLTYTE